MGKLIGIDKDKWDPLTSEQRREVFEALRKAHILSPGDRIVGAAEPFVRIPSVGDIPPAGSLMWIQRRSATMAAPNWLRPSKGWCDYVARAGKIACASLGEPELVVLGNQIVDLLHKQCLKLVKSRSGEEQEKSE